MRIDRNCLALLTVLCLVVGLHPRGLAAATIEVESDDEDVATPTILPSKAPVIEKKEPAPVPTNTAQVSGPTPVPTTRTEKPMSEEKEPAKVPQERVRVSDKVNFFNFVAAGYLAADPALVHGVG